MLNLPLRQPAVVARSAASLDLLSGGRAGLGLGAGAFWASHFVEVPDHLRSGLAQIRGLTGQSVRAPSTPLGRGRRWTR